MFRLDRDRLRRMLIEAYESGWSGCLELRSEYAESVLDRMPEEDCLASSITICSSPAGMPSSEISTSSLSLNQGYYSYFESGGTAFVNEPGNDVL